MHRGAGALWGHSWVPGGGRPGGRLAALRSVWNLAPRRAPRDLIRSDGLILHRYFTTTALVLHWPCSCMYPPQDPHFTSPQFRQLLAQGLPRISHKMRSEFRVLRSRHVDLGGELLARTTIPYRYFGCVWGSCSGSSRLRARAWAARSPSSGCPQIGFAISKPAASTTFRQTPSRSRPISGPNSELCAGGAAPP